MTAEVDHGVPARVLEVSGDEGLIGYLIEQNNLWAFRYTEQWSASGHYDLAPTIPRSVIEHRDGVNERPVQFFFDNLLPEGEARTYWANKVDVADANTFGLLAAYGKESIGALTLLKPGEQIEAPDVRPLTDEMLARRIAALPSMPEDDAAPKRMSIPGAQFKFAATMIEGRLYDPIGSWPSTHILKPNIKGDFYENSAINEWAVMLMGLGALQGVAMVEFRPDPSPYLLVTRFDRDYRPPDFSDREPCLRRHVVDGCQMLGIDREYKYKQATIETLKKLISLCPKKSETRNRLFDWLVFNALVGNGDNHLKNISFFPAKGGYELTPWYDLISTGVYQITKPGANDINARDWREKEELVFPIGKAKYFRDVTFEDFMLLADEMGIPARYAARRLEIHLDMVVRVGNIVLTSVENQEGPKVNREELKLLKRLVNLVVKRMVDQLLNSKPTLE
ncbi:HipA domain-containing protein [Chitinimonas naiadis]